MHEYALSDRWQRYQDVSGEHAESRLVFDGLVFVLVNGKLLGFDVRFFRLLGGTGPNNAPIVEPRTFLTVALLNSFLDTKMLQLAVAELTG